MKHFFNITQIVKHSEPIAGLVAKLRAGRKVEPLVELREHVEALHSLLMGWGRPQ